MRKKSAYFIGIKGVAMTSLAVFLQQKGYEVSGSDIGEVFPTDQILKNHKIKIWSGFKAENIKTKHDLAVVTGAHGGMTNIEAQKTREMGIATYMQGEILGKLMEGQNGISVCGCHGKTTTSALVASLLTHSGLNPSYIIGAASINDLGAGGHFGRGGYFVAEADEYMTCPLTCKTPRFMWQQPQLILLTNIDYDHPDAFKNLKEVKNAFKDFIDKLPRNGILVACIDDENTSTLLKEVDRKTVTYGFSPRADFRIISSYFGTGVSFMKIVYGKMEVGELMIKIPGKHNLLNALGASIVAHCNGVSWEKIKENLKLFTGTKRRFEKISEYRSLIFYDDYAHHPAEIAATIKGVREWYKDRRMIVIFQPHTFSRTKALLAQFAKSFEQADVIILTDIYPSARENFDPTVSSQILAIEANRIRNNVFYKGKKAEALSFLENIVKDNDLVITMGAGDIFLWQKDISNLLEKVYAK